MSVQEEKVECHLSGCLLAAEDAAKYYAMQLVAHGETDANMRDALEHLMHEFDVAVGYVIHRSEGTKAAVRRTKKLEEAWPLLLNSEK